MKGGRTMVRMIIALLITAALSVTCGQSKMARPLQVGMPNTITLANGQVVYDLNGDWDTNAHLYGIMKGMVRITQEDNNFVGINLIRFGDQPKGIEKTKGTLEQNGFKEVYWNSFWGGWTAAKGEISEDGNKMIIKYLRKRTALSQEIVITFQRK